MKKIFFLVLLFNSATLIYSTDLDLNMILINQIDLNKILPGKNYDLGLGVDSEGPVGKAETGLRVFYETVETEPNNYAPTKFKIRVQGLHYKVNDADLHHQSMAIKIFQVPGNPKWVEDTAFMEFTLKSDPNRGPIEEAMRSDLSNGEEIPGPNGSNRATIPYVYDVYKVAPVPPGVGDTPYPENYMDLADIPDTGFRTYNLTYIWDDFAMVLTASSFKYYIGPFADGVTKTVHRKREIAENFGKVHDHLIQNISHPGILRSLQAKLDAYKKNHIKGEYKAALNNMNAFINELNAQRGKHVSEVAFQSLKGFADSIIASLNSLI